MASSKPPCPEELKELVGHADRFARILREIERARVDDKWFIGRSGEVRGTVRFAIGDVYTSADTERVRRNLAGYLEHLHRQVARRVGYEALDCCEPDEAITVAPRLDDTQVDPDTDGATTQGSPFEDPPVVMERFQKELERVETEVKIFAHRMGTRDATLGDLRTLAQTGLLDAARSFDERRGVPFSAWATQCMRYKMLDGARKLRGVPRSVLQQQSAVQGVDVSNGMDRDRFEDAPQQIDEDVERVFSSLESSPEEIVAKRELCNVVRHHVTKLPKRERAVFEGYFFEERNLKEVGASHGFSESWASRVLASAKRLVRRMLEESGIVTADPEGEGSVP